jgi:hypothetical protein
MLLSKSVWELLLIKKQMKMWKIQCLIMVKGTAPSLLSEAEVWGRRRRMRPDEKS